MSTAEIQDELMSPGDAIDWSERVKKSVASLAESVGGLVSSVRGLEDPWRFTQESLPEASNQLAKIIEQTEEATHEILDRLEKVTERDMATIELIENAASAIPPGMQSADAVVARLEEATRNIFESVEDAFVIVQALQFQDITAQQINHASALLATIGDQLGRMLGMIGEASDIEKTLDGSFDPNATFESNPNKQKSVDEIVFKTNSDK